MILIMVEAKILVDSISEDGHRLTTMEVNFHRFVLAEFNTHRVLSRNSASSRAIPVEKQLAKVFETPAYPLVWACEQPGMQGGSELTGDDLEIAQELFDLVSEFTVNSIEDYLDGVKQRYPGADKDELKAHTLHKSLLNRLLEPFMWHRVIVSSTEWENFFRQRCSPLAQPEIRAVAELMEAAYRASKPRMLAQGDWHLPLITNDDIVWAYNSKTYLETGITGTELLRKISAARCARISYLTHDGVRDPLVDLGLYEKLVSASPPHWSPLEHVATPNRLNVQGADLPAVGNFTGWDQLRHYKGK